MPRKLVKPDLYQDQKLEARYLIHCEQIAFLLANCEHSDAKIAEYFEITSANVEDV